MKVHANAALSWSGRRLLAERVVVEGWTLRAAAEAAGVSVRCARKWVGRYRAEGEQGLLDRSSAPRRVANRTPADRVAVIVLLRRLRMTAAEIAETLAMPLSTVSAVLSRKGIGRLGRIGLEQPIRYERARPGELVHIDVKKLGRIRGVGHRISGTRASQGKTRINGRLTGIAGWEYVHVAVDDYSRLAYVEVLEKSARPRRSASCAGRSPSLPATASASSASSPTTALPTAPPSTPSPAKRWASATSAPDHTAHRPTGKPNASSARSSTAGPTGRSTAQARNAPPPLTAGSGTTTIDADTQPSATNRPSAEPTSLGPTTRRGPPGGGRAAGRRATPRRRRARNGEARPPA